jgi:hypothetical protein
MLRRLFHRLHLPEKIDYIGQRSTTWKTHFDNGHRLPLVTSKAPVTDQVLQMSQQR